MKKILLSALVLSISQGAILAQAGDGLSRDQKVGGYTAGGASLAFGIEQAMNAFHDYRDLDEAGGKITANTVSKMSTEPDTYRKRTQLMNEGRSAFTQADEALRTHGFLAKIFVPAGIFFLGGTYALDTYSSPGAGVVTRSGEKSPADGPLFPVNPSKKTEDKKFE